MYGIRLGRLGMKAKILAVLLILSVAAIFLYASHKRTFNRTTETKEKAAAFQTADRFKLKPQKPTKKVDLLKAKQKRPSFASVVESIIVNNRWFESVRFFVLFIGHSRSGHSLVSALLDAHPRIVISNEFNRSGVLRWWAKLNPKKKNRAHLFESLYRRAAYDAKYGRSSPQGVPSGRFNYHVPGEWAGRCDGQVTVIGDKKGGGTAKYLSNSTNWSDFKLLQNAVGVPVKIVHVIRDPYDNIATKVLHEAGLYGTFVQKKGKGNLKPFDNEEVVIAHVKEYFQSDEWYIHFRNAKLPGVDFIDVYSNDLVKSPVALLQRLCKWFGVQCSQSYLKHCASVVRGSTSKTRDFIAWSQAAKKLIQTNMKKYDFIRNI
eukprot:m.158296 g.158296  ORF g.158296 m.158296 type:complete len:375 (+) comp38729_c0_seq2:36-1160(+)